MKFATITLVILFGLLGNIGCQKSCSKSQAKPTQKKLSQPKNKEHETLMKELNLESGEKLYAKIDTTMGLLKVRLFWERAPKTVLNFVQLAQGKKEWMHPESPNEKISRRLYDNTIFHRVIPNFMIQGGDPLGSGFGGPGFKFKDEFHPELRHDKKGILSMANSGPNTNGSQFFITEAATPHLDNRHSVFGQVEDSESLDLVSKIAAVDRDSRDKPIKEIKINTVKITKSED